MAPTRVLWHARRITKCSTDRRSEPSQPAFNELLLISLIEWQWLPRYLVLCRCRGECFCCLLVCRREGEWIHRACMWNQRIHHESCLEPAIDTLVVGIAEPQRVTASFIVVPIAGFMDSD